MCINHKLCDSNNETQVTQCVSLRLFLKGHSVGDTFWISPFPPSINLFIFCPEK